MTPALACIGGTRAYDLLSDGAFVAQRLGPQRTPFGHSQPIYRCQTRHGEFLFLSRHGEHGYELAPSFVNYRANIYALKDLGVRAVVSWSESRALSHNFKIGQYVVVTDLVDETTSRATTFFENQGLGVVRQWPVFCPSLHHGLTGALGRDSCCVADKGVYVCVEGPRRETPAEARKFHSYGGELLGMTLAPEVFLAKELQMCYASISYVAGYAENGSDFRPFENGRVLAPEVQGQRAKAAVERLPRIIENLLEGMSSLPAMCSCETSMQHHIDAGQIGGDWRTWFDREQATRGIRNRARVDDDYRPAREWLDRRASGRAASMSQDIEM